MGGWGGMLAYEVKEKGGAIQFVLKGGGGREHSMVRPESIQLINSLLLDTQSNSNCHPQAGLFGSQCNQLD